MALSLANDMIVSMEIVSNLRACEVINFVAIKIHAYSNIVVCSLFDLSLLLFLYCCLFFLRSVFTVVPVFLYVCQALNGWKSWPNVAKPLTL
jgi:hypothetical protein